MLIFKLALVCSAEGCFHRENVGDVQFFEHGDTGCTVFGSVHRESRLLEGEKVAQFAHYIWENTSLVRMIFDIVAVNEDVLLSGVTVQIAVKNALSFFCKATH